ncbi:MAG: flagellar basal body rod protein FlgB [Dehalobacterium sp.]
MSGIFKDDTIQLVLKSLDAVVLRQKTIAHNMANINTPGFKRSEVIFEKKLDQLLNMRGQNHLTSEDIRMLEPEVVKVKDTTQRQDGNNVNMEVEISQMTINLLLYQSLVQRLLGEVSNLSYVINGGRG